MIKVWNPDIYICPLNKRVHFLVNYQGYIYECIGTLTTNMWTGGIIRGQCLEGSDVIFYQGELIAWASYMTEDQVDALYNIPPILEVTV